MHVHGSNLAGKREHKSKYRDAESVQYLKEIQIEYDKWKDRNLALKGPGVKAKKDDRMILGERVRLLQEYKDFIDQQHYAEKFDSRSNLHSSVLEEFMLFLFKDLVSEISADALIGKSHAFKDIFFRANSFDQLLTEPEIMIEKKDHDFTIGVHVDATFRPSGQIAGVIDNWDIPAVAVECKTYLDKTMLQDASTAAEQIKQKNPNAMYIVVAEWLKLTEAVNLKKYKIDQIYILRKQKNTDREFRYMDGYVKKPIHADVVAHLFFEVRDFLTKSWEGGIAHGLERGYLIETSYANKGALKDE
ncbi:Bpu10I family restriction endonuclease [Burkholderia seminalis]|uniref:Bpu10I family restriction endonuclease n=1 Tax=Burkholderia seminalis TaxID=488731 RepID=UPI0009E9CC62|nr:Bpu10I family restriction endonuclease [Burkholderia seminalis]MCA8044477.1 Bpu10I family restriction endonuclease [Burkholderia seminalis]